MRTVSPRSIVVGLVNLFTIGYSGGLLAWGVSHWRWGDRWWWLFVLNVFAPFLFLPLPLVAIAGLALRSRALLLAAVGVLVLGGSVLGPSFALNLPSAHDAGPTITVLTYNIFGHSDCTDCVVATIRQADADLVALQELTPPIAEALARDLGREYPYQVLAPEIGVTGMGTISRYPLRATGETLPGSWFTAPQLLALDFAATTIIVINAHPDATPLAPGAAMEATIRRREAQAQAVATFASRQTAPLIAPGDYNTTERNDAYATLTATLRDSWREAGNGLGHTFPGGAAYRLNWLVRIDYVFHSSHWRAVSAQVRAWDRSSDHRALRVRLALR